MPHLKHSTKKMFARASTRKKTIATGLSAEFTDYRRRLTVISTVLQGLLKDVGVSRQLWTAVAKHQRDFAETLAAALPEQGAVHEHAAEVDSHMRSLQRELNDCDVSAAPHQRIATVVEHYVALIATVEKEYPVVETAYSEVLRYQRKVDSLEKKGERKADQLHRNLTKLATVRQDYDHKMHSAVNRMRVVFDKHQSVFQCAHHAFWMANHAYGSTIGQLTAAIRDESNLVQAQLVDIDVNATPQLLPVPRPVVVSNAAAPPAMLEAAEEASVHPPTAGLVHPAAAGLIHPAAVGLVHPAAAGLVHPAAAGLVHPAAAGLVHLNIPDVPIDTPSVPPAYTVSQVTKSVTVAPVATAPVAAAPVAV